MSKYRNNDDRTRIQNSQNFLTNKRLIKKLIHKTSLCPDDHVIEIGAGKGHITEVLIQKCRLVSAIEIDHKLFDKLNEKHKRQIEKIISDKKCSRDFESYKSGFGDLCEAKDIGLRHYLICLEEDPPSCTFSVLMEGLYF